MADADRLRVSYSGAEGTFGTHPGGTLKDVRLISESLIFESDFSPSQQLRDDRQVSDLIRLAARASGGINMEMSYGSHDDLIQYGMESAGWSTPVTSGALTNISFTASDNSINRATGSFATDGFVVNQWIRVSGAANAANNGYSKITSVAALKLIVSGVILIDESAGASVTVYMGAQVVNGVTPTSISIEKKYTDLANELEIFNGMLVSQMTQEFVAKQIMTAAFQFMGKVGDSATGTGGSGYTVVNSNSVMAAVTDILRVGLNQSPTATGTIPVISVNWTVNNNLRDRTNAGSLTPDSFGHGKGAYTGLVRQYYLTKTMWDLYRNNTPSAVAYVTLDAANNAYVTDFPRVKFSAGRRVAGGENSDIVGEHPFTAFRHPTEGISARIARFPAV